jgi:hypothetical protein
LPSFPSLALYFLTFAVEVPVIALRILIAFVLATLALFLAGHSTTSAASLGCLALIPSAWSLIALVTPFGGGWW